MMGECGASILMDIIIQLFRQIFLNAVETLCDRVHSKSSTIGGTPVLTNEEEDKEWHIGKVQCFFGWAIKESIGYGKDLVDKEHLVSDNDLTFDTTTHMTDMMRCLTVVRSMRCFHNAILFDDEYVRKYYPVGIASHNHGWLCLVAKPFFCVGEDLLYKIHTNEMMQKLRNGDRHTLRDLYKSLLNDGQLLQKFETSLTNAGFSDYLTDIQVKDVWKYVLTKIFHAQIGVVTGHFTDATTGHYTAGGQTDPFRLNLKCLTRQTTIQ